MSFKQLPSSLAMLNFTDEELDSILGILAAYHAAGISVDINAQLRILSLPKSATSRRTMLATDKLYGQGMIKFVGDTEGQLCPYEDCAHDLAIESAGWCKCGHCGRPFYTGDWDGDL